jgi:hypothetical protein
MDSLEKGGAGRHFFDPPENPRESPFAKGGLSNGGQHFLLSS